jgi:hypothetical protein
MISIAFSLMIGIHCLQSLIISAKEDYYIADGSGNLYKITSSNLQIEYNPVKPENSSTGFYSGGEYVKKTISKEQYSTLAGKIQKVVDNKNIRIKDRVKGSFAITVAKGKNKKSYLVANGSEEIQGLESYLKDLIR